MDLDKLKEVYCINGFTMEAIYCAIIILNSVPQFNVVFLCTHCIIDILSLSRHILNMHGLMYVYTKFMASPYIVRHSCSIFT